MGPGATGIAERSAALVVGISGILKAAARPTDHPVIRPSDFMLADAGVSIVVTDTGAREPYRNDPITIWRSALDKDAQCAVAVVRVPSPPRYVSTSGSTRTQSTLVSHHNVVRLFQATAIIIASRNRCVDVVPLVCFGDHRELFGVAPGGRIVIVPYWISRSPEEYYQLLSDHRVTVLNQTPSAFKQLSQAEAARDAVLPLALRWVILAGEALEVSDLAGWFERHGDIRPAVINMYGITETTVHVTWRQMTFADVQAGRSMIGSPMDDLRIYILMKVRYRCRWASPVRSTSRATAWRWAT